MNVLPYYEYGSEKIHEIAEAGISEKFSLALPIVISTANNRLLLLRSPMVTKLPHSNPDIRSTSLNVADHVQDLATFLFEDPKTAVNASESALLGLVRIKVAESKQIIPIVAHIDLPSHAPELRPSAEWRKTVFQFIWHDFCSVPKSKKAINPLDSLSANAQILAKYFLLKRTEEVSRTKHNLQHSR